MVQFFSSKGAAHFKINVDVNAVVPNVSISAAVSGVDQHLDVEIVIPFTKRRTNWAECHTDRVRSILCLCS